MEYFLKQSLAFFGEDHSNKYARVALLDFIKKYPRIAKTITLYAEGLNDSILTKDNFDIETQFFNKYEINFFEICLESGVEIRGLESFRTSPLKECKTKEDVLEVAKPFITEEEYKQLSEYVPLRDSLMPLMDFKSLAQKCISNAADGIRKNFDEDAPGIVNKRKGRNIEIVICGYEHMKAFKESVSRKPVQTVAVGPDGVEYKPDRAISHDEKEILKDISQKKTTF